MPMEEYVKKWDITWDVKKYKKQLPKLEKELNKEVAIYQQRRRLLRGPDFLLNRW